jgi:putative oxidoreductase
MKYLSIGLRVLLTLAFAAAGGAKLLGATMACAVIAHLFIIGPSAIPAVALGLICAGAIYLHRDQVKQFTA